MTDTGTLKKPYYTAMEYASLAEEDCPWLVRDLIPAGGSLLIHGQAKQGKSIAAQQLAYAIACGDREWMGFEVVTHGKVLYVQLDTGRQIWKERTQALNGLGYDAKDLIYIDKVSAPTPFDIMNPFHLKWLKDIVAEVQPVVVFIDVLRKVSTLTENDSEQMIAVLNNLEAAAGDAALVVITHTKKNGSGKFQIPARDLLLGGARGSGSLVGNVDSIVMLHKKKLWYQSRTLDAAFTKVRSKKIPGMVIWEMELNEFDAALQQVLADATLTTDSERARALHERVGAKCNRTAEACRAAIRTAKAARGPVGTTEAPEDDNEEDL